MKKTSSLGQPALLFVMILTLASACHRGMICPAFQSSFIFDDSVRTVTFSLFGPDSLPKHYMVDKGKYGVIEPIGNAQKNHTIKSIQMVNVFPPSLPVNDSSLMIPPAAPVDSLRKQLTQAGK